MRLARSSAVVVCCGALACARAPGGDAPEAPAAQPMARARIAQQPAETARARIVARLDVESSPARLDVTLHFPLAWTELELSRVELRFRDEPFRARRGGYTSFVRALDASGREAAWSGAFERPGSEIVARYRVLLEHATGDPVVGIDEVPHPTRGGWFLNGRAFVPYVRAFAGGEEKTLDVESELELELPPGWNVASSAPGEGRRYRASELAMLRDALYYTGRFSEARLEQGAASVRLVTSDWSEVELAPLGTLVRRTLELGSSLLGPLRKEELLIAYDRAAERAGGVVGRGISLLHSEPPSSEATSAMGVVVVHELAHLWNRADTPWLNEGVTRYFEVLLSHRLDAANDRSIAEALLDVYASYGQSAGQLALRDAKDTVSYQGGATLAFCLDGELRARQSSLFALHQRARARRGSAVALAARDFLDELGQASPQALSRTEARLAHPGAFDASECFERAGFRLRARRYLGFTAQALALDVLGVGGHDMSSPRLFRPRPGSPFEDGDLIVRVRGEPVKRLQDVDRLLAGVRAGARFEIEVRRGQTREKLRLEMPALPAAAREQHRSFELSAVPGTRSWLGAD